MKLSIFTTFTRPIERGDNWRDALRCYHELADEVVEVDGTDYQLLDLKLAKKLGMSEKFKYYRHEWPKEFKWPFIGQQFQRGYEACSGDWVIHMDLDFLFHEKDFGKIREELANYPTVPGVNFLKHQFILPDRFNLKSRLVLAVNKGAFGDRIRFDSGGDLCQPSLDGQEIKCDDVPSTRIPFYNYEKLTKTKGQISDDVARMARAWHRHFGDYKLGYDAKSAYEEWLYMVKGRFNKELEHIAIESHPKFIQETIKNLQPDQWGYSGFGELEPNDYVKEDVAYA